MALKPTLALKPTPTTDPKLARDPTFTTDPAAAVTAESLRRRYRIAEEKRSQWTRLWDDCYAYTLPAQSGSRSGVQSGGGAAANDMLFDGTAADAVDQLAASLLAGLTPPGGKWFSLTAGEQVPEAERRQVDAMLKAASSALQAHFDRSNFMVEVHQGFLDLVIGGSACIMFDEEAIGAASAFRFRAMSLGECTLGEGPSGRIERVMRKARLKIDDIRARFPGSPGAQSLPDEAGTSSGGAEGHWIIEAVEPEKNGFRYRAVLAEGADANALLADQMLEASPFLAFRWMKAPGEVYGRSPVMKALPDIKTANKVVELVLKNASIAATGMWQADDDGVLNPANIRLKPGVIIPKAVGSAGLTPLDAPGRFDVSQLVLDDLRARIRHALLSDKLGAIDGPRMTATEVIERSSEMARLLGAVYARLQAELLTPLIDRGVAILRRRGEIPDIRIDGRSVRLQYRSPLGDNQRRTDALATLEWLQTSLGLGPAAQATINIPAAVRYLARELGAPSELLNDIADEAGAEPGGGHGANPASPLAGLLGGGREESPLAAMLAGMGQAGPDAAAALQPQPQAQPQAQPPIALPVPAMEIDDAATDA